MADRPLSVLVLSRFDGTNANVIRDFLFSFNAFSRHRYYYVYNPPALEDALDFASFDVILIFWSVYLLGPDLSERTRERIRTAPALKVLFLQDEYRDVRAINRAMSDLGVQVMFTCVAESDHETFYPRQLIPTLEATYTVLTGYVPADLEARRRPRDEPRPVDVAYRSRDVPFYLGDLGREKRVIADRFTAICAEHGLTADISVREEDRLYGAHWVKFLRRARWVLGTASGASVVDFTGDIRRASARHLGLHPEASYEDVRARFFADVDGKVVIETASPRIFEATALGCAMVLHEGDYAGVLEAGRHYVRVRRDYANIAEVVDQIRDEPLRRTLAANAYEDVIASGRYSYRAFIRDFDLRLARHARVGVRTQPLSRTRFYARSYLRRDEPFLPHGAGFRRLPTYRLPAALLGLSLGRGFRVLHGPLMSRFLRSPGRFLGKAYASFRLAVSVPCLRTIVAAYLRDPKTRAELRPWRVFDELLKIDIVRRACGAGLDTRPSFGVRVDLDAGALTLTSVRREAGAVAGVPVGAGIAQGLEEGRIDTIVWDHTPVGDEIVYAVRPGLWLTVVPGPGGVCRFDALAMICRRSPGTAGRALLVLLQGETSARGTATEGEDTLCVESRRR